MKKCSTSSPVREIQIKTTIRYHHITVRMPKAKNSDNTNAGKKVEKLDHSYTTVGNIKWYGHSGRQFTNSSKT